MTSYFFNSSFGGKALLVELPRGGYVEDFNDNTTIKFTNKQKLWSYANTRFKGYAKYKLLEED